MVYIKVVMVTHCYSFKGFILFYLNFCFFSPDIEERFYNPISFCTGI